MNDMVRHLKIKPLLVSPPAIVTISSAADLSGGVLLGSELHLRRVTVVIIVFVKTTMIFIVTTIRIDNGENQWHLKKAESVLTSKEGGDHRHHG